VPEGPLQCTVRGCRRALSHQERTWTCEAGHAFDIARNGYVNLLQPQDRKSLAAGDLAAAVAARGRLLAGGIGAAAIHSVLDLPETRALPRNAVVADLGCGGGELLAALKETRQILPIGIDLSIAAVSAAARATPDALWVVANIDRGIPLCDGSASFLISLHGRRHPAESRRVLSVSGRLVVVVPASDDLIELRRTVLGEGVERDRTARVIAEHEDHCVLERSTSVRERRSLDRPALLDLLQGTYRGARASAEARITHLSSLEVTLASDVLIFRPR